MNNKENPNIILQFVRHGDPDRSNKTQPTKEYPLTSESKDNIHNLKQTLNINDKTTVGFSGDNKRCIDTTKILVNPEEFENLIDLENEYKVHVVNGLLYKMDGNFKAFKDSLGLTDDQKSLFRVVVEKSDKFKKDSGFDFTTYDDMCSVVAEYIDKYIKILKQWEKISFKYETDTMFRVFCTNEYFYPSFRSKVEEVINGSNAKEIYILWYEKNLERNEVRKHEEQSVGIFEDIDHTIKIKLKDPYGEISFTDKELLIIKNCKYEK